MTHLDAAKARAAFSDTIDRVRHQGERIVLRRNGKDVAVLVPVSDLDVIRAIEDRLDLEAARKALAQPGRSVAWEKVKAQLAL